MEKEPINARFLQIITYLLENNLVRSKGELADILGVKPSKFSEILNNRMMAGTDLIATICYKYPQISSEWVLTGEGKMLRSAVKPSQAQPTDDRETTETRPRELTPARRRIPLYSDIASIGGYNDEVADTDTAAASVAEWIDAGDWFPEATAAIRHYGDSMVEYPAGSILVLKRVLDTRLLLNGRNYVIETTEFRVTKQLQYDGGDYLMAYSSNPETYPDGRQVHSPIKIPLETVRHIDLVLGCVQKEYSNGAIPIINSKN